MTWNTPLHTFKCGACGTTVTGLISYTYVLKVMREHDEFCKGFAPSNHETSGADNGASRATEEGRMKPTPSPLPRDRMIALVRLAQSPLAKALVALAYYSSTEDSDVADAVWS